MSLGDRIEDYLIFMSHVGDATVVAALRPILLRFEYLDNSVFSSATILFLSSTKAEMLDGVLEQ